MLLFFITFSCSSDEVLVDVVDEPEYVNSRNGKSTIAEYTKLGIKRTNPYSLTNINKANRFLYGINARPKVKTHTYVRFEPQSYDDLAILEDWETDQLVPFFDTPLEYEIVQQGQSYIDPSVNDPVLTYQYSAVPTDISLPNINYTIIADLYLDQTDMLLIITSFIDTGNGASINDDLLNGGLTDTQIEALYDGPEIQGLNTIREDFLYPPEEGCDGDDFVWVLFELIDDDPGTSPYYWRCVYTGPPIGIDGTGPCGCPIWSNTTRPDGCIQVDQNGVDVVGVEIAQVNVRGSWFNSEVTYSDDQGCWRAEDSYIGKVGIKVKFKNDNVKVRDTGNYGGQIVIVDETSGFDSPPYNDHYVLYGFSPDPGSLAREYWVSANTLNFVNQYRTMASADNIPLPKKDLNWLNNSGNNGGGAAPMLQWNSGLNIVEFLLYLAPGLSGYSLTTFPDIWNNYGEDDDVPITYQEIQSVAMHELGHASHYELVGESYWDPFRRHVILNGGDGDFGNFAIASSPGLVALGEAVAEYIQEKYGLLVGAGGSEGDDFENNNFVPAGLLLDLEDPIDPTDIITDVFGNTTTDNIAGFTPEMFYNALNPDVRNIRDFKDELGQLHLSDTPNNLNDYNNFIDVYDVFN